MKPLSLHRQRGVTLVELLIALTLGMLVSIAAMVTLVVGRTGFNAVDATSQLIDRERFAADTIARVVAQAGYEDQAGNPLVTRAIVKRMGGDPEPDLFGWNNAVYASPATLAISAATTISDGNRPGGCGSVTDTSCLNGSDVLVVRFQGSGGGTGDGTMVNCRGEGEPGLATGNLDERAANIFYVNRDAAGEPSLYCAYYSRATNAWVAGQPLVEGVEAMQVLYGTDSVTPATVPAAALGDTIVDRWLRADQLKVAGNAVATRENWRRVRAVRIGLLLRGAPGSAQERITATFNPLGTAYSDNSADAGSALATAADGRLRRVVNFTVHLRNDLSTR